MKEKPFTEQHEKLLWKTAQFISNLAKNMLHTDVEDLKDVRIN